MCLVTLGPVSTNLGTPFARSKCRATNAAMHAMGLSLEQTANDCIDRFVQWSFSLVPYIHPTTLKQHVQLLLPPAEHLFTTTTTSEPLRAEMRTFALVTGACAFECRRMGHGSSSHRVDALCIPFLTASRDMLACFEDWGIAHADSSSLAIRMAQSGAFHNLGQTRKSWHILGEALRLAMDMRLFDEASYLNLDPLEAKLHRNLFACIYMADKSASILNSRPMGFLEICLDDVTIDVVKLEDNFPLLDPEDERSLLVFGQADSPAQAQDCPAVVSDTQIMHQTLLEITQRSVNEMITTRAGVVSDDSGCCYEIAFAGFG
ncbi:hypothetical protein BDW75DRAFT_245072 [Aspergillus navahoensis]